MVRAIFLPVNLGGGVARRKMDFYFGTPGARDRGFLQKSDIGEIGPRHVDTVPEIPRITERTGA